MFRNRCNCIYVQMYFNKKKNTEKEPLFCINHLSVWMFSEHSGPNRYKLTRALFLVPRTRLDLLPLYSRLVAILKPVAADLGDELCGMLLKDFAYQLRKKDQMNIETKVWRAIPSHLFHWEIANALNIERFVFKLIPILSLSHLCFQVKTVRFLAELTKFRVLTVSQALRCLKRLLADFSHHAIDMSCHLVECCGRFLFLHRKCSYSVLTEFVGTAFMTVSKEITISDILYCK